MYKKNTIKETSLNYLKLKIFFNNSGCVSKNNNISLCRIKYGKITATKLLERVERTKKM